MLQLHNLEPLKKKRKRIGRGGGRGGTSGRGHKGQRARSGGKSELRPFFEGGQMPITRRLPRRGFTNIFKKQFTIISLRDMERLFDSGDVINRESLREKGLVKGRKEFLLKVLCNGVLTKKFTVYADAWSKSAEDAIKKAGGQVRKEAEGGTAS
jgi:large subunit ribosomal protein L15